MAKQPFTPVGLQDKLLELYAFTDADLLLEAQALSNDLQSFLNDHFTFSADEENYISSMDARTSFGIGSQLAAVLVTRGEIKMDEVPVNIQPKRPKEIILIGGGENSWDNDSGDLTSTLSAEINWRLL